MVKLIVFLMVVSIGAPQLIMAQASPPTYSQEVYTIRGSVRFKRSYQPIEGAEILVNGGKYTETDSRGDFRIRARKGDELILRHPKMETVYYTILSDDRIIIEVEQDRSRFDNVESETESKLSFNMLMDSVNVYLKKDAELSVNFVAEALQKTNSNRQNAEAYEALADIYSFWKQYDLAISNYKISLQNLEDDSVKIKLGRAFYMLKDYGESLNTYNTIRRSRLSPYEKVELLEGLAEVYLAQDNFKKALDHFHEGLEIAEKNKIISKITNLNSKIATAYANNGLEKEAGNYFNQALNFADQENIERSVEQKVTIADFQNKNRNYLDEIELRKSALVDIKSISKDSVIENESAITPQKQNYKIGTAYFLNDDNANAKSYLEESIKEADAKEDLEVKKDAIKKLSDVYVDEGDYEMALETFKKYTEAVDQLYIQREQEISQATRVSRKIAENQNRITSLELDKKLSESTFQLSIERGKRQEYIIYSLIIGLILVLILTYVMYKYIKQQKYANNILALKSLRSQMNPHFIFNALNSVNSYIASNDERAANKYLSDFSYLMREVLENSEEDFIPLEKELHLLKLYTKLEHFRFIDKFDYSIDVDKAIDLEDYQIPPMLLQPYIENAVWHGLRYKEEKGILNISINKTADEQLMIVIADNGIGRIKSEELKTDHQRKHKSKGLSNINKRIEILNTMYKDKIKVEIIDKSNKDDTGTMVKVTLNK